MRRGFTVTELVIVVAIFGVTAMVATPLTRQAYVRHQVKVAANQVQSLVQQVRMSAVKEKVPHRLVLHDENAVTPNRIDVQKEQGGSFVTQHTYALPGTVRLLDSSLSSMTVSSQGICSPGKVYVRATEDAYEAVSVKSTCLTESR